MALIMPGWARALARRQVVTRRTVSGVALAIGVAALWIFVLPSRPEAQPIPFDHARHQKLTCAACHRGVKVAARATLPGPNVCAKCHATAPAGVDSARWTDFQRAAVNWIKLTRVPDHAMFSHQRHVTLGRLDCASCHGDIGRSTEPPARAPIRVDMESCRACHQQRGASEDCADCHR